MAINRLYKSRQLNVFGKINIHESETMFPWGELSNGTTFKNDADLTILIDDF